MEVQIRAPFYFLNLSYVFIGLYKRRIQIRPLVKLYMHRVKTHQTQEQDYDLEFDNQF